MAKHYRWNKRKCAQNLLAVALIGATGYLIGWIFAQWLLA